MRNTAIGVLACVGALAVPLGAQTQYNVRVAVALAPRGKYEVPLCPLKGGDYRTASAGLYLKTAAEGMTDDLTHQRSQVDSKKYTDIVNKAIKAATDAIAANPQSAAAWYYLGRGDLQLGDLRGADSAFTRVETLSPDCAIEIKGLRQRAWLVLVQPSTEFMRAGQLDSSLAVLRDAMIIARYYPQGFYNLAGTFANMKPQPMIDSAIFYFKIAQEKSATDTQFASTLKNATYNMAYLYQSAGDNQNAIVQYRKYLAIDPNDVDVKRALASTLRLTGSPAEAAQLEQQLMSSGSMTTGELATMGVQYFADKNYAAAADAFQKILATDPVNHDALYNLANSYFAMGDAKKLIETSQKLLDIDPLGSSNLKLLANGYRLAADTNKQIEVVMRLQAIPVEVSIDTFRTRKDGAKIAGTVTGKEAENASGKTIPPAPMVLVFEFTNAQGAVVATQEAPIPVLAPNATRAFGLEALGAGIVAWRYHPK